MCKPHVLQVDCTPSKAVDVVVGRGARPADVYRRTNCVADVGQSLRLGADDITQRRRAHEGSFDAKRSTKRDEQALIHVDEAGRATTDALNEGLDRRPARQPSIYGLESSMVFAGPSVGISEHAFVDAASGSAPDDWHREQPGATSREPDPTPFRPPAVGQRYVVKEHQQVDLCGLREPAEPRQIVRLVNGDPHAIDLAVSRVTAGLS